MVASMLGLSLALTAPALAKNKEGGKAMTLEEAINDAEAALDGGRVGDAIEHVEKLQRTHGLKPDEVRRLDLIIARCGLVTGKYDTSEKIFAKLHKAQPDDARLSEWYARALEGTGKTEQALTMLSTLAAKGELQDGDSYWTLAQLEKAKGDEKDALAHAKLALEKPIVLQSDELDSAIHKFIDALSKKQSKGDNK
jgi:predicted Zn-dependent protease